MLKTMNIVLVGLLLIAVPPSNVLVRAQTSTGTRCLNACQNSPTCASGLCTLQSCTDTGTCYEYCLNCSGVVTCYASGYGCSFNSSSSLKFSLLALSTATVLSYLFFKRLQKTYNTPHNQQQHRRLYFNDIERRLRENKRDLCFLYLLFFYYFILLSLSLYFMVYFFKKRLIFIYFIFFEISLKQKLLILINIIMIFYF